MLRVELKMIMFVLLITVQFWPFTIKPTPVKSLPCCSGIRQKASCISFKKQKQHIIEVEKQTLALWLDCLTSWAMNIVL